VTDSYPPSLRLPTIHFSTTIRRLFFLSLFTREVQNGSPCFGCAPLLTQMSTSSPPNFDTPKRRLLFSSVSNCNAKVQSFPYPPRLYLSLLDVSVLTIHRAKVVRRDDDGALLLPLDDDSFGGHLPSIGGARQNVSSSTRHKSI
jgi:hypothetical protein